MAKLACTSHLEKIGPIEERSYEGSTVLDVINTATQDYPRFKHYVLDDQERVRKHIAIFINSTLIPRDDVLQQCVSVQDDIFIMQALSGG